MAKTTQKTLKLDPLVIAAVEQQIKKVEPIMKAHGGGVQIIAASRGLLILGLKGHCADCAMAPITFGLVLEKYIREALPELKEIKYTNLT